MKRKTHNILAIILACMLVLTACSTSGKDENPLNSGQTVTLKVMYFEEAGFFREFGELLYAAFPNLEIEVVSMSGLYSPVPDPEFDYNKAFIQFIEDNNPDILVLSLDEYERLYKENRLVNLEPKIASDKYDIEAISPMVIEMLRDRAGGQLHGLAPKFGTRALYYNVDLFDRYGVPHPTDQMTWEEVIQLAKRFPVSESEENRLYGLTFNDYVQPVDIVNSIAETEGIVFVDPDSKQMTVKNEDWERILTMVADLFHSGVSPMPRDPNEPFIIPNYDDYLFGNPFTAGTSAMMLSDAYLLDQLNQAAQRSPDRAVNFELVTAPVSSSDRERGGTVNVYQIFAINATSDAADAAWEVIKYVNGDDLARAKSRSSMDLLSRTGFATKYGKNIEAFYKLKPSTTPNLYRLDDDLPGAFKFGIFGLLSGEVNALIRKDKTVDEVLDTLQNEGQKLLMAGDSGVFALPGGDAPLPAGDILLPEGEFPLPEGAIPLPEGEFPLPEGELLLPEGEFPLPEGAIPLPEGAIPLPEGEIPLPEGELPSE
jgi:multiple sugar transport system substrate-binding protein